MADYDLQRFISTQESVFPRVVSELRSGHKQSHWMWFVFPQIQGLGVTQTSKKYAIANIGEARAYLADPVLSDRLRECTDLVMLHASKSVFEIFGSPDDMKFHACMTLFDLAEDDEDSEFRAALDMFFGGIQHQKTLEILKPSLLPE